MVMGQSLWVVLVAYACSFLGALQVPVLMATLTYALAGFIYNVKYTDIGDTADENNERNQSILEKCASFWEPPVNSTPQRPTEAAVPSAVENVSALIADADESNTASNKNKVDLHLKGVASDGDASPDSQRKSQSEIYFKALFMACLVTILYRQLLVLCLAFIPVAIYLLNRVLDMFGFKDYAIAYLEEARDRICVSKYARICCKGQFCVLLIENV